MATIYALKCLINGYVYIGCTSGKIAKRMREHRCLLNKGVHKSTKMQSDWKQYGQEQFAIIDLERLPIDAKLEDKRQAELKWMQIYEDKSVLYNLYLVSFRPTEEGRLRGVENSRKVIGNRWTPEANLKRSLSQLGRPKGHGAKISAAKRAKSGDEIV